MNIVKDYMQCLAGDELMKCSQAESRITKAGMISNYVGVLHTLTKDSQVIGFSCFDFMA